MEVWKDIPGFEGLYQISDIGRIKSLERSVDCNGGIKIIKERIMKSHPNVRSGHYSVNLRKDKKYHRKYIHRLVLKAFVGEPPEGTECCHSDGNPGNNKLDNLRWDTRLNNIKDSQKHGSFINPPKHSGSKHPQSKLNEEKVKKIKEQLKNGFTQREIAKKFNVSQACIKSINKGETWRHV